MLSLRQVQLGSLPWAWLFAVSSTLQTRRTWQPGGVMCLQIFPHSFPQVRGHVVVVPVVGACTSGGGSIGVTWLSSRPQTNLPVITL